MPRPEIVAYLCNLGYHYSKFMRKTIPILWIKKMKSATVNLPRVTKVTRKYKNKKLHVSNVNHYRRLWIPHLLSLSACDFQVKGNKLHIPTGTRAEQKADPGGPPSTISCPVGLCSRATICLDHSGLFGGTLYLLYLVLGRFSLNLVCSLVLYTGNFTWPLRHEAVRSTTSQPLGCSLHCGRGGSFDLTFIMLCVIWYLKHQLT